jgi:predicted metal-dependent peptidase
LLAKGMMPMGLGEEVAREALEAFVDWKVSLAECLGGGAEKEGMEHATPFTES